MSQAIAIPTRHTIALEAPTKTGARWGVVVIEAGQSVNGSNYPPETLKAAEHLFADLPIYAYEAKPDRVNDHLPIEAPREFLAGNVAGWVRDAHWDEERQAIVGEAEIVDPRWREELLNAHESREGRAATRAGFGLSIICLGLKDGSTFTQLVQVPCVEIVTHPAAGGRFETVLASLASKENQTMKTKPAPAKAKENAGPAAEMLATFETIAGWIKAFIDGPGSGLSDEQLAPLLQAHQELVAWSEMENLDQNRSKELEARVESLAADLDGYRKLLSENAMSAAFDSCGIEFHDRDLALSLIDNDKVKVSDDFQSVEGLKEQLEALAEAKPFLVKTAPDAESKPAEPEKKPAAESTPARPSSSGQSVTVQESVAAPAAGRFASLSREQLERRFNSTLRQARSGNPKALGELRALRLEMQRG